MKRLLTKIWMVVLVTILAVPLTAQTVTVQVDQSGGLWDALEAQGVSDFTTVKSLTVTGMMGESDFLLIKNQMSNLEVLDISGTNATEIPNKTFYQKEKLKTVRLPEEITYIRSEAFYYCQNLESVTFGNQAVVEGKIVFPASLRYVDNSAFNGCQSLTKLDFSSCTTLEGLGGNAFQNLYNLQEVLFPSQGNLRLEWYCFGLDSQFWDEATQQYFYKGLKTLTLTKAVTYLSGYALPRTLNTLYVESVNPPECEESAFTHFFESESISIKVYVPKGSKRNYAIANGWSKLYQYMQEMGLQLAISGYGSVQQGNRTYTDGDVVFVNADGATTLKAVPEVGCELISVKLNGNAVSVAADGTFTVPAGTTVGTLELSFTSVPMVVNNPNGGELKENIAALGSNPHAIRALKVVGKLTTKDWTYIKSALTALEDFDISETDVKAIPEYAFQENQVIKAIHLPSTIITIDRYAFQNCQKLTTVDGCENVETLRERAFQYCSKLANFPFGDTLHSIESAVFENCSSLPESLVMPASLTSLDGGMFNGSSVRSFDLSQCEVRCDLSYNAFGKCTSLLLPEKGDYRLCYGALKDAELTELRLPAALTYMYGEDVLPTMLKRLYVSRTTPINVSSNTFNNIDFDNCTLYVPSGSLEAYEAAAYWSNFYDVKELGVKIIITGFGSVKLGNIAFSNGDVYMPMQGSTATLNAVPDQECQLLSVTINGNAVSVAADGSFTIPEGTNTGTINVAFSISQTVVDNPNGGELKDKIAAMGLTPNKVRALKVVGKMANKDWNYVMSSLSELQEFDISETNIKAIPESAFQNKEKLTTVHLPSTVTTISNAAFNNCPQLTIVDGCENVNEIGSSAFGYCYKLSVFPFGDAIQRIESDAFMNCSSLPEKLVMPASLTTLGWSNVFNGSSIRNFDLSQCEFSCDFGYNAFGKCTSLLLPEKGEYRLVYQALKDADLTELRLPAALSYVYGEDVLPTKLERLYVSKAEPFNIDGNNVLRNLDLDNCILYVPIGSANAYDEANVWSSFTKIKEYGFKVKTDAHGTVKYAGKNYKDGEFFFPPQGDALTLQIVPSPGYDLATLKVNGTAFDFADDGTFTIPATIAGGSIEATFTNRQLEIAISIEGNGSYTIGEQTYTAATTLPVNGGDMVKILLQPATGSFVKQITIDGQDVALKNGGLEVTTAALDANTSIAIVFSNDATSITTVTFQQDGFGIVSSGSTTFEDGSTLTLVKDKNVTLSFAPYGDSDFKSLFVNDVDVTANVSDNAYTLTNVSANTTVKTTFFSPNMVTVDNPNGGELKDMLAAMGCTPSTLRVLKVTGKMTTKDWNYVKSNMPQLEEFDISETDVKFVPEEALCDREKLTTVRLPSTISIIYNSAFRNCPNLTTVDGCENVIEIGNDAFGYCYKLSHFPFGNKIKKIEAYAFHECRSLPETLVMPASLNSFGWGYVFSNSSVTSFDLSQCTFTNYIGENTFGECTFLLLPENGDYYLSCNALRNAHITELRLPAAVSGLNCENALPTLLERLYVSRTEPIWTESNAFKNLDFDNCTLYVPQGYVDAYASADNWSNFTNIKEFGMLVTVGEQGKVRAGTQTMMGTTAFFPTTSSVTFEIIPNAGWHADAVTVNGTNVPFADNKFTLSGDQLSGKLAVSFAINQFALKLQLTGDGQVKLGSLVYTSNQVITVDSLSTLNFTLVPAEGLVVSAIAFNGQESVVQNGGTTYVTPAITANSTLAITFAAAGAAGDVATYNVTTGEGGSVEYKNTTLLPETTIQVKKGEKAVFTIKPEDYYIIEKVLFNGTSVIDKVAADGKLTIENVDANATLEVAFRVNAEIAVNLDEGIRLTNLLNEKQKQLVTKLTITGRMQESDFFTMRDEMPMLSVIDMWQAETDYIPYNAFCTSQSWDGNSVGKKTLTSVRLPEGTHRIYGFAFAGCTNLKEVNFTALKGLEWLESYSFENTSLQVIDLSNTKLTEVYGAFRNVKGLENIKFPQTLTKLGDVFYRSSLTEIDLSGCTNLKTLEGTFYECKNLVKVTLPEGLTTITSSTFSNCEKLTTINFPSSLVTISGNAFYHTNLQKVDLSSLTNLQSIGDGSFQSCQKLAEVLFPSSLVQMGNYAFNNCPKLTSIDLSKTKLQNIPDDAFSSCETLESVKLPKTIETINRYAFAWDNKLGGVLELGADFTSIGECAFAGTQISVIRTEATTPPAITSNSMPDAWVAAFVPEGYADLYKSTPIWEDRVILDKEVHADVTVSFEGNLANDIVEQAHIAPATVTHLKVHGPIGAKDFAIMRSNMTLLYDLDLEDAECNIIPENAFLDKKVLMNVKLPRELLVIQENAFRGCSSLKGTLTLPAGVTTIGWAAFQGCTSLEKVELSEALEVIRGYAFEGCSSLQQELTFPQYFTSLGVYAFANCRSLYGTLKFNSEFYMFMGNEGYWSSEGRTFENCSNIEVVDMTECEYLYQLPQGVFSRCTSLHTVMLPPYLERIEYYGFEENTSLRTIAFPSSLMYIDDGAFQNCSSLKSINLSDCQDFGTLGGWAFANNASLESVNLPASLNWIGSYAFSGCRKLGEINVEALEPADLGDYVFQRVHTERCVLSIPTGTYSDYLSAPQWGEFVSMRKAIDVSLDEGASLTYSSGDGGSMAAARSNRRAAPIEGQQGNVSVKDGSSLYVAENDNVTFYINPDENVSIKQVLYNGEDVTDQLQANAFVTPGLTDNTSFKVLLNVDGPITVKELRVLSQEMSIRVAESAQISATVYPTNATDKTVFWSSADESIVTVDEYGVITGHVPGHTTVTAKTKDGNFEKVVDVTIMSNDYYITLAKSYDTYVETELTVPLLMHNADAAKGIQFDVYLPDGLEMNSYVNMMGRDNGHTFTTARRKDGSIRVMVYSQDGNNFYGNDGELLSLPIMTLDTAGEYDVQVKNIHISGPKSFDFVAPNYVCRVKVKDFPLGDSNGDGEVSISDVTNTVNQAMEQFHLVERFKMKPGDVNSDGFITVTDVSATADILMGHNPFAGSRSIYRTLGNDRLIIDDVTMDENGRGIIELRIDNMTNYTAMQCDLFLPEGLKIACDDSGKPMVELLAAQQDNHLLAANNVKNGAMRIMAASMKNTPFADSEEGVVRITVEAEDISVGGQYTAIVDNVTLVTADSHSGVGVPAATAKINFASDITPIHFATVDGMKVSVDGHQLIICTTEAAKAMLVSVNGVVRTLQLAPGINRISVPKAGIYVLNKRKIIIR